MINEFLAVIGPGEKMLIGACTIIGFLCAVIGKMFYRRQTEILAAIEKGAEKEEECRVSLPKTYASWDALLGPEGVLTEIRKDRKDKWHDFDRHRHADKGVGPPIKT